MITTDDEVFERWAKQNGVRSICPTTVQVAEFPKPEVLKVYPVYPKMRWERPGDYAVRYF